MINILLDTDLGSDCDDVGALALLHILRKQSIVNIIGITHSNEIEYGPAAIRVVNNYFNYEDEIGVYCGEPHKNSKNLDTYAQKLVNHFDKKPLKRSECKDAVYYIRERLSKLKGKCKLVCIGQLNNFYNLLNSNPDINSKLCGKELICEKVEEVILMAGLFSEEHETILWEGQEYITEYNLMMSGECGKMFIEYCPVPITFCDFLLGNEIMTLGWIVDQWKKNPLAYAYKVFANGSRQRWDILTVLYAVYGTQDLFYRSEFGKVKVDQQYRTSFFPDIHGENCYLKLAKPKKEVEKRINRIFGYEKE